MPAQFELGARTRKDASAVVTGVLLRRCAPGWCSLSRWRASARSSTAWASSRRWWGRTRPPSLLPLRRLPQTRLVRAQRLPLNSTCHCCCIYMKPWGELLLKCMEQAPARAVCCSQHKHHGRGSHADSGVSHWMRTCSVRLATWSASRAAQGVLSAGPSACSEPTIPIILWQKSPTLTLCLCRCIQGWRPRMCAGYAAGCRWTAFMYGQYNPTITLSHPYRAARRAGARAGGHPAGGRAAQRRAARRGRAAAGAARRVAAHARRRAHARGRPGPARTLPGALSCMRAPGSGLRARLAGGRCCARPMAAVHARRSLRARQ